MEKLEEEICKNKMLEKETVIKNNMIYIIQCMQLDNQNKFLESKLQPQITTSSHMGKDHSLWSAQIDPLTVMASMYTKDNEWPGIVCLEPDFSSPPHGDDSDDPGHQEATVMHGPTLEGPMDWTVPLLLSCLV